ncbi:hypothetical protein C8R44DRAFT_761840 [Mycena epipterygia]|nr:hypothetical protein C8R44DRAFT_761840 [Mycena epipterygia]
MTSSQNPTTRLLSVSDPPRCPLPALLGPATQSACFSICNERLEVDSTAALRYFTQPPPNANLRDGLDRFMGLPFKDRVFKRARRLDNVFTTCLCSENSEELLKAEVVTWRGIMKKIMLSEKIDLNVSYHNGVLYLEEDSTRGQFDKNSEALFMGHRFETICSTATPGGEPDATDVDLHTLWNAAITRTLGSLNILLVGEVDCVKPAYFTNPGPEHYVELKTRKRTENKTSNMNRGKMEMQSHLLGTTEIFVGFPDSEAIVRGLETFPVRDMAPAQYRIDWGARVLHSLRDYCACQPTSRGGGLKVWRIQARNQHVDIRELGVREVQKLNKGGVPRNGIIPLSFIAGLESRMSTV